MITNARNVLDRASTSPRIPEQRLAGHLNSVLAPAPHTSAAVGSAWTQFGGTIVDTVDWPQRAASWLKPARQLVRTDPDAWVIIDNPAGCAQLVLRLAEHEDRSPIRTYGTASLDSPDLAALTGFDVVTGMRGVTAEGGSWRTGRRRSARVGIDRALEPHDDDHREEADDGHAESAASAR